MFISDRDLLKFVVPAVIAVAAVCWALVEAVLWVASNLSIYWG